MNTTLRRLRHLKNLYRWITLKKLLCIYVAMYHTTGFYKKNMNDINAVIDYTSNYAINSSIFNEYDAMKAMMNDGKTATNARSQSSTNKREKHNKPAKGHSLSSNGTSRQFNVNYAILKYLIDEKDVATHANVNANNNGEKQTMTRKYMSSLLGAFNNELKTTKSSPELEFQTYKIKFCELIQANGTCIKEIKLNPSKIYEKLVSKNYKKSHTNDYNFDLDVFFSLLKTCDVNCVYLSYKCAYIMNCDFNDKFYVILNNSAGTLKRNGFLKSFTFADEQLSDDAYTLIKMSKDEYDSIHANILKYTYVITDLKKPIKSVSSYKVSELQEIAPKLGIIINKSNGKPKTKQELYDEFNNKVSVSI